MFGLLRQEPGAGKGTSLSIVDTDIKPLRRVRACIACRNRKLKCSLARPQCTRCEAQKIACHYPEAGESSKKDLFADVETALGQPKDSASVTDEASLKRKRAKKVHVSSDQRKQEKKHQKVSTEHGTVVKKEKSRTPKNSTGSHPHSLQSPPTPTSPNIAAEDAEENQHMASDGSWLNHLLLYTPGEGLEICDDTMDMMGMTSPWLDFAAEGLGGVPRTGSKEGIPEFTSATRYNDPKPSSRTEPTNPIITPVDESMDLEQYFTDPTSSPDMLLQSPAYTDLLLSNTSAFPGNEDWTWEHAQKMNNLDLLTPTSSVPPFEVTAPPNSSSGLSSLDSPSSSAWSHSSESTGVASAGSPSFMFSSVTSEDTGFPVSTNTQSVNDQNASSNKRSKHRSRTPPSKSTSATRQELLVGCYAAHTAPLHQALERLQVSSFAFLQAKAATRNRHGHGHGKDKDVNKKHTAKHKQKDAAPPYEALLKSQKQALSACGVLLDCASCSARSDLVMLVISVCGLLVGSLEGLNGNTVARDATTDGDKHVGLSCQEQMTWKYRDGGVDYGQYDEQWAGVGRPNIAAKEQEHELEMDEEDRAQIIRTLTATRITKLSKILDLAAQVSTRSGYRMMDTEKEEDWSAHLGLVYLLKGKLKRYSGVA
ncbi:hypothetical protein V8F20_012733 [Naviculisporaceae sp. PSN 640]